MNDDSVVTKLDGHLDGLGVINRSHYPQTGWVNFPGVKVFTFWYYPDEDNIIYWDQDRGNVKWEGGVASDCDYKSS